MTPWIHCSCCLIWAALLLYKLSDFMMTFQPWVIKRLSSSENTDFWHTNSFYKGSNEKWRPACGGCSADTRTNHVGLRRLFCSSTNGLWPKAGEIRPAKYRSTSEWRKLGEQAAGGKQDEWHAGEKVKLGGGSLMGNRRLIGSTMSAHLLLWSCSLIDWRRTQQINSPVLFLKQFLQHKAAHRLQIMIWF